MAHANRRRGNAYAIVDLLLEATLQEGKEKHYVYVALKMQLLVGVTLMHIKLLIIF